MADFYNKKSGEANAAAMGNEDFQEEEVWAIMKGGKGLLNKELLSSPTSDSRMIPTPPRLIPRGAKAGSFESQPPPQQQQQKLKQKQSSAPISIPDWSKNLKRRPNSSFSIGGNDDHKHADQLNVEVEVELDEDGEEMLPPHEMIARRIARSPIASYSMCEGKGRTLKGRDLSELRNAILTKTGFLE